MRYNQPYGVSVEVTWGEHPYVNGDPSIGRQGSIPPGEAIEFTQREIVNVIRNIKKADGTDFSSPTNADLMQLAKAIQSALMNYTRDTGTANNYDVTLSPAPDGYFEGMTINFKVGNTNTGNSVMNVNAFGSKQIVKVDGSPLVGGEMGTGSMATVRYDGTKFQLTSAAPAQIARLTANKHLYVNNSIGNDSNDGLSDTAGHALATIQKAIDIAYGYAPSQFTITIHISGHTYTAGGVTPLYPGPSLAIVGAGLSSTIVNVTNNYGFLTQGPNVMNVSGVRVNSTVSALGPACFAAANGATLITSNCASQIPGSVHFNATAGATVRPGNHTYIGNCYAFWWATFNAQISLFSATHTFSGAQTVAAGSAWASGLGSIGVSASNPITFVGYGNVTGPHFNVNSNGFINSDGQGVNFFPGTTAGSFATGGQYV